MKNDADHLQMSSTPILSRLTAVSIGFKTDAKRQKSVADTLKSDARSCIVWYIRHCYLCNKKMIQEFLIEQGYKLKPDGVIGPKTLSALKEYISSKSPMPFDLLSGWTMLYIRTNQSFTNKFSDFGIVIKGGDIKKIFPASTKAGDFYVFNPLTVGGITGTAVAAEQYAHNSHTFVTARNWSTLWLKAPYFKQTGSIMIYRDGNRDRLVNKVNKQIGMFGINLHRGGLASLVNRWSAGCNVAPDADWFEVCKLFSNGDVVSYCLIEA